LGREGEIKGVGFVGVEFGLNEKISPFEGGGSAESEASKLTGDVGYRAVNHKRSREQISPFEGGGSAVSEASKLTGDVGCREQ